MIRAAFFASGVFIALLGAAAVLVDRVVLTDYAGRRLRHAVGHVAPTEAPSLRLVYSTDATAPADRREVVDPPDWAGFCLLSIGGVTLLYSLCLPGRRPETDDDED